MSRRNNNGDSFKFKSEESVSSDKTVDELREKISHLPVNSITTIYFRYISREAKLPVELPPELLSATLLRILENPYNIAAFGPCLRFTESKLHSSLFPDFLRSDFFSEFCVEIIVNDQLTLSDVLFEEALLVNFIEFLAGDPTSILLTFLMAVNAYKKEFSELMLKKDHAESVEERHQQLLHDATTICAKYLSPASDDFMGLTLEQYRSVLDVACAEKEPRENCFDDLYKLIYKTVEKNILPSFFVSSPFSRYRSKFVQKPGLRRRYIRKNGSGGHQSPPRLAPIQLNVLALCNASLANRLPRVYMEETVSIDGDTQVEDKKRNKFYLLFKKDHHQE